MKKIILTLLIVLMVLSGCSMVNPGYISSKPDVSNLKINKSTLKDVTSLLGDPAIYKMSPGNQIIYTYYYKTPQASVDQVAMIKGDYTACKNCGKIVAAFAWDGAWGNMKNFPLQGLSVTDPQLKAQTIQALALINQKQFKQAYPKLLDAAQRHYLPAQYLLGLMYSKGDGVEKDYQQAHFWLYQAAIMGSVRALYDLGVMYRNGEGVAKDNETAKKLYTKSAQSGYALAMRELAKIYKEENNTKQMNYWLEQYQQRVQH